MGLLSTVSPTLDGGLVTIGDGSVIPRSLKIDSGYTPPFWLQTAGGHVVRVNSLPWQGRIPAGQIEVLSSAPGGGANPNEPSGLTQITDTAWDSVVPSGWVGYCYNGTNWNVCANPDNISIVTDATAPRSASNVVAALFPAGFNPGGAPVLLNHNLANNAVYMHFWFKFSSNWYGCETAAVNKIFFVENVSNGSYTYIIPQGYGSGAGTIRFNFQIEGNGQSAPAGPSLRYEWNGCTNGDPNEAADVVESDVELVRGEWRDIEMYLVGGTPGSADGEFYCWIDGKLVMQYTNQYCFNSTVASSWTLFHWGPTYGGACTANVPADQYQYLDHVYLSGN